MSLRYWELLSYRALAELKRDSSNMYLGMLWWVLEPVLYMLVFYIIFGVGLRKGGEDYAAYLLCALVPWKWFESTVRTSSGIIMASPGLMRQLYFPKWILPGYIVLANTYKFLIVLTLLLVFLLVVGVSPLKIWLLLPVLVFLQLLLVSGLSFVVAAVVPLIPDLRYVVSYAITMLFFLSGVFFDVNELSEPVRSWLLWNPVLVLLEAYRSVLMQNVLPSGQALVFVAGVGLLLFLVGFTLLRVLDRYYPRLVI